MNLAVAVLLYACVSPSEEAPSLTILYKCPAPTAVTGTIAPEDPPLPQAAARPAPPPAVKPAPLPAAKPKASPAGKPKPASNIPSWVQRRATRCAQGSAKWYFSGYWKYRCKT